MKRFIRKAAAFLTSVSIAFNLAAAAYMPAAVYAAVPSAGFAAETAGDHSAGTFTTATPSKAERSGNSSGNHDPDATSSDALFDEDGFLLDGEVIKDTADTELLEELEIPEAAELPEEAELLFPGEEANIVWSDFSEELERDNDDLLQGYFEKELMPEESLLSGKLLEAPRSSRLSGIEADVYAYTKAELSKIASGKRSSSNIVLPYSLFGLDFDEDASRITITSDDVGGPIMENGTLSAKARAYVNNLVKKASFDGSAVNDALLADCPYEFYWSNKWSGVCSELGYSILVMMGVLYLTITDRPYMAYPLDPAYRKSSSDDYSVNTTKTKAASAAATNARAIVSEAASLTDYNKLVYYRNQICKLTSYNTSAAESGDPDVYGTTGPWQVIYVFDKDTSTKVVCEGYAKAFKYLCDLSDFDNSSIECIMATGMVSGGIGSGGHMWNVVRMDDGKNYLVDVTNCDTGMIGNPDKLFLRGYEDEIREGNRQSGYAVTAGDEGLVYYYFDSMLELYSENETAISGSDYKPPVAVTGVTLNQTAKTVTEGDSFKLTATVAPSNATNKTVTWSSSKLSVAKVTGNGLSATVTALAAGTTAIKVTTEDGSYSATCNVTVKEKVYPVTGVTLNQTAKTVTEGDSFTLTATVAPSNATNKTVTWSSSKSSVAKVTGNGLSATVTALAAGTAVITVTTENGSYTATCNVTVNAKKVDPVEAFVRRLYSGCFNRGPDAGGLKYWTNGLKDGTITGASAAGYFFQSQEMAGLNLSDTEFINRLYTVMMDRTADANGRKYWLNCVENGISRTWLIMKFIESEEFTGICQEYGIRKGSISTTENRDKNYGITSFVARIYRKALGRSYDVGGLNYWTGSILSAKNRKDRMVEAAVSFLNSEEFRNKNLNDEAYIEVLYQTFFDRGPDTGGMAWWKKALSSGKETRNTVLKQFAYSSEFSDLIKEYGIR